MTKIQTLTEKVTKAQETVEKRKGTIERHKKQLDKKLAKVAKYGATLENIEAKRDEYRGTDFVWDFHEVTNKLNDIKGAEKKLAEAERILAGWEEKLEIEQNKDNFINANAPKIILDFLEDWKQQAQEWYIKRYKDFQVFKVNLRKEQEEAELELGMRSGYPPNKEQRRILEEKKLDWKSVRNRLANFAGQGVLKMCEYRNEEERLAWLNNMLEKEKKAKLLDLINRITAVVGIITDANNLKIKGGDLNGIIIGEKGKAKVNTIGAGGWNIQCFHYRVLITKL
ncbi:nuclear chromosome segregation [Lysinibacillus phage vB_LfM_LysYB1]|nr:nuclear chromosome segregation [Lysinibacillus phage vB_LfM_LysYB1]WAB25182.1 nuclear chromosome segregation [Lysinibacillus phage vB_LfM_LysYB2]